MNDTDMDVACDGLAACLGFIPASHLMIGGLGSINPCRPEQD